MNKKAQLTLFIVIGIIVLAVAGIGIYLYSLSIEKPEPVPEDMQPIKVFVDDCIKDIAERGIYYLGTQGGYLDLPEEYIATEYSNISYGYFIGENKLISLEQMSIELQKFVDSALMSFIDNFSIFHKNISYKDAATTVVVGKREVIVKTEMPVTLQGQTISQFKAEIPVSLGYILSIADDIVEKTKQDPDWLDLSYLASFDVNVSVVPIDEDELLYVIKQNEFMFLFGARFSINNPPVMKLPNKFNLTDDVPFTYTIEVVDENPDDVVFSDDSALFDIMENGMIAFTPHIVGEFNIIIRAVDVHGAETEKTIIFEVNE